VSAEACEDDRVPRTAVTLLALLSLVNSSCASEGRPPPSDPEGRVVFSSTDASLTVRVADSDDERAFGLMGVGSLPPDEGMAFVYDKPSSGYFWMRNTLIPLSIAFVDAEGRILAIQEMTPCTTDDCPTWDAGGATFTLAIEANAGWFRDHGVSVGDRAELAEIGRD
jgi:hypothetical protein